MVSSANPTSRARSPQTKTLSPLSTRAFDWVFTVLVLLLTAGIYLDGWSHSSFGPDQSVFSEYHLLFYSSLMAIGIWLFGSAFLNRRDGYVGLNAIPAGYKLSALGLIIFGITGVFDLGGHALWGFEVDNEALYSPTHIGLFIGWSLICIGPLRAALHRQRRSPDSKLSLWEFAPALLGWIFFFNVLAFVSMNFFATAEPWMITDERPGSDYFGQMMGIMGMMIQSALTVGVLAYLILHFRLPLGTFTLFFVMFGLFSAVDTISFDLLPVMLIVGMLMDGLYALLRPSFQRQWAFHSFNVLSMLVFWGVFYAAIFITNFGGGVWWTPYIWTGSIVQGMVAALFVSLMAMSAPKADALPAVS